MAKSADKKNDAAEVEQFMKELSHPLKKEMQQLREIIMAADTNISERFKWKAPSYHVNNTDFLTFNPRDLEKIHLVFHHPFVETIKSELLEGDYKGRRMTYFKNAADIAAKKTSLTKIIRQIVKEISD